MRSGLKQRLKNTFSESNDRERGSGDQQGIYQLTPFGADPGILCLKLSREAEDFIVCKTQSSYSRDDYGKVKLTSQLRVLVQVLATPLKI